MEGSILIKCDYLFFTKAGATTGLGHLRRCLAIASYIRRKNKSIYFFVDGDSSILGMVKKKGFKAITSSSIAFKLIAPKMTVIDRKDNVSRQIKLLRGKGSEDLSGRQWHQSSAYFGYRYLSGLSYQQPAELEGV